MSTIKLTDAGSFMIHTDASLSFNSKETKMQRQVGHLVNWTGTDTDPRIGTVILSILVLPNPPAGILRVVYDWIRHLVENIDDNEIKAGLKKMRKVAKDQDLDSEEKIREWAEPGESYIIFSKKKGFFKADTDNEGELLIMKGMRKTSWMAAKELFLLCSEIDPKAVELYEVLYMDAKPMGMVNIREYIDCAPHHLHTDEDFLEAKKKRMEKKSNTNSGCDYCGKKHSGVCGGIKATCSKCNKVHSDYKKVPAGACS